MIPLHNSEVSRKIGKLDHRWFNSDKDLIKAFSELGLTLLAWENEMCPGNCQDWAFKKICLPQYCNEKDLSDLITSGKIVELLPTGRMTEDVLVAYSFGKPPYEHYGISVKHKGQLLVESKWCASEYKGRLFRHPLEAVHPDFGNYVNFYKKHNQGVEPSVKE